MTVFLRFWDLHLQKLLVNMLVKLSPGVNFINILHVCTYVHVHVHMLVSHQSAK